MAARDRPPTIAERVAADERRLHTATAPWTVWFRHEFLRSCFVGGCLVWLGLGVLEVRYLLDPWHPGQGAPPAWVSGSMLAFFIGSLVIQILLYRRWWPSEPGARPIETLDDFQAQSLQKKHL